MDLVNRNRIILAIMGIFFVTSLLTIICLVNLMSQSDEVPLFKYIMESSFSQYYPSMAYFIYLSLMVLHLLVMTALKMKEELTIENFLKSCRSRFQYMINTCTNQVFAIFLCVYATINKGQLSFYSYGTTFYLLSYYVCHYVFGAQFYMLQQYKHARTFVKILIDVFYYLQMALMFFSNVYSVNYNDLPLTEHAVSIFLLYQICYHLFIQTPVFLIVCIFVFLQFIKVIYTSVNAIQLGISPEKQVLLSGLIILASCYEFRIMGVIYRTANDYFNSRVAAMRGETAANNEQTNVEKRQYLEPEEIEKLQVMEVCSMEVIENGQPMKVLPTDQCTVCDQDIKKLEKVYLLDCKHRFHQDCLVPWLKVKNSCPNCRTEVIKIN